MEVGSLAGKYSTLIDQVMLIVQINDLSSNKNIFPQIGIK